jgi:biopolymer transport protein ExbB/TolQ
MFRLQAMGPAVCVVCGAPVVGEIAGTQRCATCSTMTTQPVRSDTQPSLLLSFGLAAICAIGFYGLGPLLLLRNTPVFHLFCGHGWVPYVAVGLFFIALWGLLLKIPLIKEQQSAFLLRLLPDDPSARIEPADAQKILSRISRLTPAQNSLMLVIRVRQAILRLNQLGTAEKLDDILRYRAEADEAATDSSYAAPKFIIWAIPVLGFVGTVIGISNGVQSFSSLVQNASDLDGLRESLKGVTYGLGQAFETTMIALCMSIVLMFVMSVMQRWEDGLLASIDDYCMENLLHKIHAPAAGIERDLKQVTEVLHQLSEQMKEAQVARVQLPVAATKAASSSPAGSGAYPSDSRLK